MHRYLISVICIFLTLISTTHGNASSKDHICENEYAKLDADFEGARMSSCVAKRKKFIITIEPENKPINPSPWYAFRVTPKQVGKLELILRYDFSGHRYRPKRSKNAKQWHLVDEANIKESRKGKKVRLRLTMEAVPFFIAGQELLLAEDYQTWAAKILQLESLHSKIIGHSVEGRSISAIASQPEAQAKKKEHVLFVGRQHPPEVTGGFAMLPFLETVFSQSSLAKKFRARFHITAVPLMNPDGVAKGHWRHNANGVDLNRDWGPFTQPETQAIKTILDAIANDQDNELRLMMDFHSTKRNVFYTQFKNVETIPPNFTGQWIAGARERLEDYEFERAERETTALATSKNYVNRRFGAPAITYELGDQTDRQIIRSSAVIFAEEMMKSLLASDTALEDKENPAKD